MKRITYMALSALLVMTVAAHAGPEVKVGGNVDMRYTNMTQSDPDGVQATWEGGSNDGENGVELTVDVEASDSVSAHIKINMPMNAGAAYAEEATVAVKASDVVTLTVGKNEMPVGQNIQGLLEEGYVAIAEIKEKNGLVVGLTFSEKFGMDIATFEDNTGTAGDEDRDTGLFQSYALSFNITPNDKMAFEVSTGNQHNDLATGGTTIDNSHLSLGGDMSFGKVGVYFEYVTATDSPETGDAVNGNAIQIGVDIALAEGKSLAVEINTQDEDTDADDNEDTMIGVTYNQDVNENTTAYAGFVQETQGGAVDDTVSTLIGAGVAVNF